MIINTAHEYTEASFTPIILDLYLRKTRPGKSHKYRDTIVFENSKLRQSKSFPPTHKRKHRLEERFLDGLAYA